MFASKFRIIKKPFSRVVWSEAGQIIFGKLEAPFLVPGLPLCVPGLPERFIATAAKFLGND